MKTRENAHCTHILYTVYLLNISGACSHILVLEELITDQQVINGHGFIVLHMFETTKSLVGLMLQHFIEVI